VSPILQAIENFEQREQLYAEAAVVNAAAIALENNTTAIEALVDAAAPQGVAAVISAVEKADAKIPEAAFINAVLSEEQTSLDADLAPLIAQGGALIPKVVTVLQGYVAKLQAKAATL
jgi:hypothetical protein